MRIQTNPKPGLRWTVAAGCAAVAAGGIFLLHSSPQAAPVELADESQRMALPEVATVVASSATPLEPAPTRVDFEGPRLSGWIALAQGAALRGGPRVVLAEVSLAVDDDEASQNERRPVAMAVVLDTSGSMQGDKIEQARQAVIRLIAETRDSDHLALVTYNSRPTLAQPLAPVGRVREAMANRVQRLSASGGTDIPAALQMGLTALSTAPPEAVQRIVLVSDGRDGSGSSLTEIARAVAARAGDGVTTSSLGVGTDYDESFLTAVAGAGTGSYVFLERSEDLPRFLTQELAQAGAVTANEVVVDLSLPQGMGLPSAHGAQASGSTGLVRLPFGALCRGERRRAVVELLVQAGCEGRTEPLRGRVTYRTSADQEPHELALGDLALDIVSDQEAVDSSRVPALYADALTTVIDSRQARAVAAWRRGDVERAVQISRYNVTQLRAAQAVSRSDERAHRIGEYERDAERFQSLLARSQSGRAYGLRSNWLRLSRGRRHLDQSGQLGHQTRSTSNHGARGGSQ